jgi:hypothetical protein
MNPEASEKFGLGAYFTQNPSTARKCWVEKYRPVMMKELNPI